MRSPRVGSKRLLFASAPGGNGPRATGRSTRGSSRAVMLPPLTVRLPDAGHHAGVGLAPPVRPVRLSQSLCRTSTSERTFQRAAVPKSTISAAIATSIGSASTNSNVATPRRFRMAPPQLLVSADPSKVVGAEVAKVGQSEIRPGETRRRGAKDRCQIGHGGRRQLAGPLLVPQVPRLRNRLPADPPGTRGGRRRVGVINVRRRQWRELARHAADFSHRRRVLPPFKPRQREEHLHFRIGHGVRG